MGHFAKKDHGRNAAQQIGKISTVVFPATHQPALLFTAKRCVRTRQMGAKRACGRNGEEEARQLKVSKREKAREEQKEH